MREAVLDECNVLRRARLHRRAAEALTALGEERHLEEIAMHLFEAASTADARRAAEMLVRAGHRALDRLAYEDAAERFERALEALELAGAEDESGPVLLARGDALLRAGEPDAARAAFTAARELALRLGDHALLAQAALGFAGLGIAIVDLDALAIAPARGGARAGRGPRAALARSGAPWRRALLRARSHPLGGAERRRGRNGPGLRRRERPRLCPGCDGTWRCGDPTASRSGWPSPAR